jgi:hypothetical protein
VAVLIARSHSLASLIGSWHAWRIGEIAMILESAITCPHCATAKSEAMPTDACRFFYECTGCGMRLRPKAGDCCVFCSYGSVPCPPMQVERAGDAMTASCRQG